MTSYSKIWNDHKNIYTFEVHIREITCVQKLKFGLAFKQKKTSVFYKTAQKVVYYDVIFEIETLSSNNLKIKKN